MAGALLAVDGLFEGTLSGGDWEPTLPITNLLVPRLSAVARTVDATRASCVINRDYGAASARQLTAIVRSNLSADALWRVRRSDNADMSSATYDTGWIACWPEQWPTDVLQPSDLNAVTRRFTNAQLAQFKYDVLDIAPEYSAVRYERIEFDDEDNPDGFIQIGFAVSAPVYQPGGVGNDGNLAIGAELGEESTSTVGLSLAGVRGVMRRRARRTLTCTFPALSRDEAIGVLRRKLRTLGQDGYVYVVTDPADVELRQEVSFLAQVDTLSPTQLAQYGQQSIPVKFLEVL